LILAAKVILKEQYLSSRMPFMETNNIVHSETIVFHTPVHPAIFTLLILPYGILGGYVTVTLAYLFSKESISVDKIAVLVAIGPHCGLIQVLLSSLNTGQHYSVLWIFLYSSSSSDSLPWRIGGYLEVSVAKMVLLSLIYGT
jgi:hypothetical protein